MQSQLVAGETLNYRATVAQYPASDGWALRLVMNPRSGGAVITINSMADGDAHLVRAPADATALWAAGAYGWELWALKAGEQYRIDAGQLEVLPGLLSASGGVDTRSQAEQALAAIEATLAGKASSAVQSYQINGRHLSSYSIGELVKLRELYRREVASERRAAGLSDGRGAVRRIAVRCP